MLISRNNILQCFVFHGISYALHYTANHIQIYNVNTNYKS